MHSVHFLYMQKRHGLRAHLNRARECSTVAIATGSKIHNIIYPRPDLGSEGAIKMMLC